MTMPEPAPAATSKVMSRADLTSAAGREAAGTRRRSSPASASPISTCGASGGGRRISTCWAAWASRCRSRWAWRSRSRSAGCSRSRATARSSCSSACSARSPSRRPKNLVMIVWDNAAYQITGGQPTATADGCRPRGGRARLRHRKQPSGRRTRRISSKLVDEALVADAPVFIAARVDGRSPGRHDPSRSGADPRELHARARGAPRSFLGLIRHARASSGQWSCSGRRRLVPSFGDRFDYPSRRRCSSQLAGSGRSSCSSISDWSVAAREDRLHYVRRQNRQPQDAAHVALGDVLGIADLAHRGVDAFIEHSLPPPRPRERLDQGTRGTAA